jgi:predicted dehydrogenase
MGSESSFSRRSLLKAAGVSGAALGVAGLGGFAGVANADESTGKAPPRPSGAKSVLGMPFEAYGDTIRVGIVGVGRRGTSLLRTMLNFPEVQVTAVCDINPDYVERAAGIITDTGRPEPAKYAGRGGDWSDTEEHYQLAVQHSKQARAHAKGKKADEWAEEDYRALCARDDVDIVVNVTSWEWHHPICMVAMLEGKHTATDVPLAMELDHLWDLVNTSERTQRHCIMLEQVVYWRHHLQLLNMAHEGVFGELLCGYGGYENEGLAAAFDTLNGGRYPEGWRRRWWYRRDGDFYSMHGFCNIAMYMDVNRGDKLDTIASMSTPQIRKTAFREEHVPSHDPAWDDPPYIKGDRCLSLVSTEKGRVIEVSHDEDVPSPYSIVHWLTGTKGSFKDHPARIFLEGKSSGQYDDLSDHSAGFDHWLWEDHGFDGDRAMFFRLFQDMRLGRAPDIDVYDSATWTAPIPLSTESLKRNGQPVKVPDFTRNRWQDYREWIDRPNPEA